MENEIDLRMAGETSMLTVNNEIQRLKDMIKPMAQHYFMRTQFNSLIIEVFYVDQFPGKSPNNPFELKIEIRSGL